jgi:hypothetical protein
MLTTVNIILLTLLLKIVNPTIDKTTKLVHNSYTKYATVFKWKWIYESLILQVLVLNYKFKTHELFSYFQIFFIFGYIILSLFSSLLLIILDIWLYFKRKKASKRVDFD